MDLLPVCTNRLGRTQSKTTDIAMIFLDQRPQRRDSDCTRTMHLIERAPALTTRRAPTDTAKAPDACMIPQFQITDAAFTQGEQAA